MGVVIEIRGGVGSLVHEFYTWPSLLAYFI